MTAEIFQLVTVVCEPVLASKIVELTKSMGASGFTMIEVKGEGSGEKSSGEIPEEKIKIEIVTNNHLAAKIKDAISETYFSDYSIIVYSTEISVIRSEKF